MDFVSYLKVGPNPYIRGVQHIAMAEGPTSDDEVAKQPQSADADNVMAWRCHCMFVCQVCQGDWVCDTHWNNLWEGPDLQGLPDDDSQDGDETTLQSHTANDADAGYDGETGTTTSHTANSADAGDTGQQQRDTNNADDDHHEEDEDDDDDFEDDVVTNVSDEMRAKWPLCMACHPNGDHIDGSSDVPTSFVGVYGDWFCDDCFDAEEDYCCHICGSEEHELINWGDGNGYVCIYCRDKIKQEEWGPEPEPYHDNEADDHDDKRHRTQQG